MANLIRIKCPKCQQEVSVDYHPNMERQSAKCPYCKVRTAFKDWEKLNPVLNPEPVRHNPEPVRSNPEPVRSNPEPVKPNPEPVKPNPEPVKSPVTDSGFSGQDGETQIYTPPSHNVKVGQLTVMTTGTTFQLHPGNNVVGRMAEHSSADIQIPDPSMHNRMSREHIIVEARRENGEMAYYASLYKANVNLTYLRGNPMIYGQPVRLIQGDQIIFPDHTLMFEIIERDEEGTSLAY